MRELFLDIETLPAEMGRDEIRALAADKVPANYRDPAKIDAWIAENAAKAHASTALDSMMGRVLMVAWAVDDGPVASVYLDDPNDCRPALAALAGAVSGTAHTTWIGHNVAGFDLPYLRHAAFRARHPLAREIPDTRYSSRVRDTMAMWAGTDPRPSYVGLSAIARFLGIGEKADGMDGSHVYPAWLAGRHEEIRAYGEQDVALVRDVYRVLVGSFPNHTPAERAAIVAREMGDATTPPETI